MGIVGAVILTGAMIAVFYYENTNANGTEDIVGTGDEVYTVQWVEETHPATPDGKKFTEGETLESGASVTYDVTIFNYTREITVALEWEDQPDTSELNAEDTFRVELLSPDGAVLDSDEGDSGSLTLNHTVAADAPVFGEPEPKTVMARGNTTTEAENAVKAQAGSAQYQLRVTLVSTNSQVPPELPAGADTGNEFTVYLGYTHWHAYEESNLPQ